MQVRTPEFKAWFGDWEIASSKPERQAATFTEAREQAKAFQGKPLTNAATGIVATVSRNNLDKMLSSSAVHKSESAADHALAVANLDALFERAITGWTKSDRDGDANMASIRRMFTTLLIGGKPRLIKLTIKEFSQSSQGNRIYSVEAIEVGEVSPVPEMVDADRANGSRLLTGPTGLVESMAQRVRDFNPAAVSKVTDPETGEPLVVYHGTESAISIFERGHNRFSASQGFYFTRWANLDAD